MNNAQLAARRSQIDNEAAELDRLIGQAVTSKNYSGLGALEARVDQLAADRADLDATEVRAKALPVIRLTVVLPRILPTMTTRASPVTTAA